MKRIPFLAVASVLMIAQVQAADLSPAEAAPALRPAADENPALLGGLIKTNTDYTEAMLDWQSNVNGKALIVLRGRQEQALETGKLYMGAGITTNLMFEHTNTAGKFAILGRLPGQHGTGSDGTQGVIANSGIVATLTPTNWLTLVAQGEYNDLSYPGQPNVRFTKHYALLGDLDQTPFYLKFGRDWVDFGHMDSYTPYTHTTVTHYFWGVATNPTLVVGYAANGWHITATGIMGERQQRVLDAPADNGMMPNYALSATKEMDFGGVKVKAGASYLAGTIYDSTITHHTAATSGTGKIYNPAATGFIEASWKAFDVKAEFATTLRDWPATQAPVQAVSLQGRYRTTAFDRPTTYSASCARGTQAKSSTAAYQMTQCVMGAEIKAGRYISFGAEYIYNNGFVPLVMPLLTADAGVETHTLILGAKSRF